jgi:hypothetical protein
MNVVAAADAYAPLALVQPPERGERALPFGGAAAFMGGRHFTALQGAKTLKSAGVGLIETGGGIGRRSACGIQRRDAVLQIGARRLGVGARGPGGAMKLLFGHWRLFLKKGTGLT